MQAEAHLAGLLILNAVGAFSFCFAMPGIQSYAVSIIPSQAGAIMGLIQLCQFGLAGVFVWASTPMAEVMDYGWLFTFIAGLQVFSTSAVVCFTIYTLKQDGEQQEMKPVVDL